MAKSRRRQSPVDQIERLANGRCPVHGLFMGQVDGWFASPDGRAFTLVECPRKACEQRAKAYSVDGPWESWDGPRMRYRVLAQNFLEYPSPYEVLTWAIEFACESREHWINEVRPRRPLPPYLVSLFEEIADRATEL